jgi:hypothetical protein
MSAGWIKGEVVSVDPNGVIKVNSLGSLLSLSLKTHDFSVGSRVALLYDAVQGRVSVKLEPQVAFDALAARVPATEAADAPKLPLMASLSLPAALALSSAAPVEFAQPTVNANAHALAHVFPVVGTPSFAFAAAFFPLVINTGLLSRLTRTRKSGPYGDQSRMSVLANRAIVSNVSKSNTEFDQFKWIMPFIFDGEAFEASWEAKKPIAGNDADQPETVLVELTTRGLGHVVVSAVIFANKVMLTLATEHVPDAKLLGQVEEIAELLAARFSFRLAFSHASGLEAVELAKDR